MSTRDQAIARFGQPNARLSSARELRFGRKGSVAVDLEHGLWYDHESRQGGRLGGAALHDGPERRERPRYAKSINSDRCSYILSRLHPIADGSPGYLYLRRRGIDRIPDRWLMERHESGVFAIVAVATILDGDAWACQQIYTTQDGAKIEHNGVSKRTHTLLDNWQDHAAYRVRGKRGPLVICEGVVTALSVWIATGRSVVATFGVSNIGRLRTVGRKVIIAADGDAPGSQAYEHAENACRAMRRRKVDCRIARAPLGQDWNDVLMQEGAKAVKDAIS